MQTLLYIQASPRIERSHSIATANAFIDSYKQTHTEDQIQTINLFKEPLPSFDGLAVQAKYTILHGKQHSPEELQAWEKIETVIDKFNSADKYIMAVPMWNFTIPYRLKQYFDIIVQPGYTFSYDEQLGYQGLITDKPIFIIYSRGGKFSGTDFEPFDLQKKYLEQILGFIGFTDIRSIIVEPTVAEGPGVAKEIRSEAIEKAIAQAKNF